MNSAASVMREAREFLKLHGEISGEIKGQPTPANQVIQVLALPEWPRASSGGTGSEATMVHEWIRQFGESRVNM